MTLNVYAHAMPEEEADLSFADFDTPGRPYTAPTTDASPDTESAADPSDRQRYEFMERESGIASGWFWRHVHARISWDQLDHDALHRWKARVSDEVLQNGLGPKDLLRALCVNLYHIPRWFPLGPPVPAKFLNDSKRGRVFDCRRLHQKNQIVGLTLCRFSVGLV